MAGRLMSDLLPVQLCGLISPGLCGRDRGDREMVHGDVVALRDAVRRFVRERLQPLERRVAEEDAIPEETIDEIRQMGLFGLSIPTAYGGLELSMAAEVQIVMEIGWSPPPSAR